MSVSVYTRVPPARLFALPQQIVVPLYFRVAVDLPEVVESQVLFDPGRGGLARGRHHVFRPRRRLGRASRLSLPRSPPPRGQVRTRRRLPPSTELLKS